MEERRIVLSEILSHRAERFEKRFSVAVLFASLVLGYFVFGA